MYCNGINCVERHDTHQYTNVDLDLKLTIPAHICSNCEAIVYEPDHYKQILEAEEKAQGRPYIRVEIKNGKISKYSVH